ncbi:hypothetical protein [Halioxenophilus aromaticivorans]|uniref:Uncharacterized protein n=1 Tax=Halioxenophilus aromaticivorans TaxID=1306992 RepID=A0AAV3U9V1_9ALTE
MSKILKVGIDIHGVIDTYPEKFKILSNALVAHGSEVHIVTGSKRSPKIDEVLQQAGIAFTHYFSIVEHLEASGEVVWQGDQPFADQNKWNRAKRDYCHNTGIDLMFDDSPVYRETFHDTAATYLHVIN